VPFTRLHLACGKRVGVARGVVVSCAAGALLSVERGGAPPFFLSPPSLIVNHTVGVPRRCTPSIAMASMVLVGNPSKSIQLLTTHGRRACPQSFATRQEQETFPIGKSQSKRPVRRTGGAGRLGDVGVADPPNGAGLLALRGAAACAPLRLNIA
jgi:hypothetical protein